jgi:hypothetical protein
MKSLALSDLNEWLRHGSAGAHFVYETAAETGDSPAVWRDARERAHALFVRVLARVVLALGLTPTFPAPAASDWRKSLGLSGGLVAVWNFDYSQLSVSVCDNGPEDCIVVVARHVPV